MSSRDGFDQDPDELVLELIRDIGDLDECLIAFTRPTEELTWARSALLAHLEGYLRSNGVDP